MNKDIVYIDVEDDITAIIGKVRASAEKIVVLVPPKRIGVLQSAVNLRLLNRTADQVHKRLVLITNNKALAALAATASIPVAKNLQSKPEIAEIPALEMDDDDVIDGSTLPVGDLEKTTPRSRDARKDASDAALLKGVDVEEGDDGVGAAAAPSSVSRGSVRAKKSADKKVPNFNAFRKKIFILVAAAVALTGVLIWAFVFAPAAKVIITAHTTPTQVKGVVQLSSATDAEKGTIKAVTQSVQKKSAVEFTATGEKDVGEKATGRVRLSTGSIANLGLTIAAGTPITSSSGLSYVTDSAVTFNMSNYSGVAVGVTAAESGTKYNAANGSVSGLPSGVSGSFVDATSGGTSKTVPIVTAGDVQSAREKLVAQSDDEVKAELTAKFTSGEIVLADSFVTNRTDAVSTPAVGAEATNGKASLSSDTTFTLTGVAKADVTTYLEEALKSKMPDQTTQKVFDSGIDTVQFTNVYQREGAVAANIDATGQLGPVIDETEVKEQVAGKKYGDIQSELSKITGVTDVEVKFPYFWVRTVPKDVEKITIEFKVDGSSD